MANLNFYNTVRASVDPPMIILLTINCLSKVEICRHELPLKMLEEKELAAQYKNITRKQANSSFLYRWTCEKSKKENSEDWFCNNQNCILNTNTISRIFNKTWSNLPKTFKKIFNEQYEKIKERRLKPQTGLIFITDDQNLYIKNAPGLQNNNQTAYGNSINNIVATTTTHKSNINGNSLIDANGASPDNRISYDDSLNVNISFNSLIDQSDKYSNLDGYWIPRDNSPNINTTTRTSNIYGNSLVDASDASSNLNSNRISYDDSLNTCTKIYGNSSFDLDGMYPNGEWTYDHSLNIAITTHTSNFYGNSLIDPGDASSNLNDNQISYDDSLNANIYDNSLIDQNGIFSNLNGNWTPHNNSSNIITTARTNNSNDRPLSELGDASFRLNDNRIPYDSLNVNIYGNSLIDLDSTIHANFNDNWLPYDNHATTTHISNIHGNSLIDSSGASSNLNGNRIFYDDSLNTNISGNSSFDPDGTYSI
ncbi:7787_t:CDS:1 [Ambispora leptoticha]|uniref:7787_t:CDS:1 n=1 Tax=Ambispora leptoticha TaxID=144679 RepID=A0A9N9B151_9GLOM|nr:7787_t:CDS:1 [Ambispora leptoticha]